MRILYHHRTLGDGAEGIHIGAMVAAFRDLGHEVEFAALTAAPDRQQRRRVVEGIRSVLPRAAFEMASLAYNVPEYVQARRDIERFSPDLVYKRHARYDVAVLQAARHLKVAAVLEVNCLFTGPHYEQFEPLSMSLVARALERRALELAAVVVAVSSPLARDIRSLAKANVLVVPNGADPDRFDPRRADGERVRMQHGLGSALTVGWAGILRDWHGLGLLLEALASVPSVTLLVVGDGPARSDLERRTQELGLDGRIVITGRVPHAEMPHYIAAMDIAVVAEERTGVASPMKLLEYMSMGRAILGPRADNIRDLVEDGVDGLLFEPGDAGELAAGLRRLTSDTHLREALGRRARVKIERDRNWRRIAEVVLAAATSAGVPEARRRTNSAQSNH